MFIKGRRIDLQCMGNNVIYIYSNNIIEVTCVLEKITILAYKVLFCRCVYSYITDEESQ